MARRRYLIIGDGAAGTSAAEHVRRADPQGLIAIYSDDPHPAYFRAALTNYLLGELTEQQLWAVPPNFYQDHQVHRGLARVAGVDPQRALVYLASGGAPVPYDALLVATGSRARPPPFQGGDLPGVMTMRTLQDARDMMDQLRAGAVARAVVAYRPGAHYFATRLYDLDFASVGSIAAEPNAEPLVDFPRDTGRISYR